MLTFFRNVGALASLNAPRAIGCRSHAKECLSVHAISANAALSHRPHSIFLEVVFEGGSRHARLSSPRRCLSLLYPSSSTCFSCCRSCECSMPAFATSIGWKAACGLRRSQLGTRITKHMRCTLLMHSFRLNRRKDRRLQLGSLPYLRLNTPRRS